MFAKRGGKKIRDTAGGSSVLLSGHLVSLDGFTLVGKLLVVVKKATCYIL